MSALRAGARRDRRARATTSRAAPTSGRLMTADERTERSCPASPLRLRRRHRAQRHPRRREAARPPRRVRQRADRGPLPRRPRRLPRPARGPDQPEAPFLRRLRGFWWQRYRGGGRPPGPPALVALGRQPRGLHKLVDPERFEAAAAALRRATSTTEPRGGLPRALRALLWPLAERRSARAGRDELRDHAASAPTLARVFPEARFVHVVRDGRDALRLAGPPGPRPCSIRAPACRAIRWWEGRRAPDRGRRSTGLPPDRC